MPPKKKRVQGGLEKKWEAVQVKAFSKWINAHLSKKGYNMESLSDLSDGIMLVRLLEILSETNDWSKQLMTKPKFKIHKIQNINIALDFIKSRNVPLHSIGAEDVLDGNRKLTLGLIWMIILRFEIAEISVEELSAKEALLLWCQKKTKGYNNVNVTNFTFSFQDGLAFCAIIHKHRPNLLDFDSLSNANKAENLELAFKVAEEELGIPRFLDAEDMTDVKPDERSVMTYVSQFFHKFSGEQKYEVAARRISNLVALTQANDELKAEYVEKAKAFKEWTEAKKEELDALEFDNTLEGVKVLVDELKSYVKKDKPGKQAEKTEIAGLFNNIQVKLRNAKRPLFVPPEGLAPEDLNAVFAECEQSELARKEKLTEELARQEKIALLLTRFFLRVEKLLEWAGAKLDYLQKREVIDSVNTAQAELKLLDSHDSQYDTSLGRVESLKALGNEIVELDYIKKDDVMAKMNEIDGKWIELKEKSGEKREWLDEELKKQQYMDELRKKFAQLASDTSRWHKDEREALEDVVFPETLEAVEAYEEDINAKDADLLEKSGEKVTALQELKGEMDEAGIVDNRYTEITLEDIDNAVNLLKEAIAKLRERYAAELARQQGMEAKRKEYAEAVEDTLKHLEERKVAIDALEGEPEDLMQAIDGEYNAGEPEKEKMEVLQRIDKEAIDMRIVDNKYTEENNLTIQSKVDDFDIYISDYKKSLTGEKNMKENYAQRVEKLFAWVDEQIPKLEVHEYDNTLDGIATMVAEDGAYKSSVRPPVEAEKADIWQMHSLIVSSLQADPHNRPEFAPQEGQSLDEITAKWTLLADAEKARGDWLKSEFDRQEKLDGMQKKFYEMAGKIEDFCAKKKEFLEAEIQIASLTEANVSITLVDNFKEEYEAYTTFETFKELGEEIVADNYCESEAINAKAAEVEERFNELKPLTDSRSEVLSAALEKEKGKEDLRVKFADLAKECEKWIAEAKNKIDRHIFGDDLETVKSYAEKMEAEEAELLEQYGAKKEEIDAVWGEMQDAGITENVHTDLVQDDIHSYEDALKEHFQTRREAYEKELEGQEGKESKMIEFADAAKVLVEAVDALKEKLSAVEGEPEERETAVQEIYGEGAEVKPKLEDCLRIDSESKELKIIDNKHTPYSARYLESKVGGLDVFYNNLQNFIQEEKTMKERALKTAEEWAAKEKIEGRRSEFAGISAKLTEWLDFVDEQFREEIVAHQISDVEELNAAYGEIEAKKSENEELFNSLEALNSELSEAGVETDYDSVKAKWEEIVGTLIATRRTDLDNEMQCQETNEGLRVEYANVANALNEWIEEHQAKLAAESTGELEDQLKAAEDQLKDIQEGEGKLSEPEEADSKLVDAGVRDNPHTTLTLESLKVSYAKIVESAAERKDLLEKQIMLKKGSEVSAEDLAEFQEMFKMFDKDNSNSLQWYEFKAALASLGEDLDDDEVRKIITEVDQDGDEMISFEEFTAFMIKRRSDTDTSEQISEAFADLANGKQYVTKDDLKTVMEEKEVEYLAENMPLFEGEEGKFDFSKWTEAAFSR